jgi:hypothetical protein
MEISIYGLVDSLTNEIRYVGKTTQTLNKRLSQHLWDKNKSNPHKFNWIQQLKSNGLKPIIILLETCDESNWVEREKFWIQKLNNLTNITQGGENGIFFTPEILEKISNGVKKAWENEDYKKRQSEKSIEYWSDLNHRKQHSIAMTGKVKPDDAKEKVSKFKKEQWDNSEYREKMSNQSKELWNDKNYQEKVLSYIQSDENKKKVSERFKGKKLNDSHKKKMSDSSKIKKPILVDGILYESITEASIKIPINRDKLRSRLKSKHFPNYTILEQTYHNLLPPNNI